jgi:hypothetical protein
MSEFQFLAFRAIDGPVSEKNLQYMRRQSSRAEITPWSFENEYHFGDFRGNADEMLRRGYDMHLHYANYGVRKLMIRLPSGLPNPKIAEKYLDDDALQFQKDKRGPSGTLVLEPHHEPGDLEYLWDLDDWFERLVPLRAEIQRGDLRPLYIAHLAVSCDMEHDRSETIEAPVPAGLKNLTRAQQKLADFYEVGGSLLAAAAVESAAAPADGNEAKTQATWLEQQSDKAKTSWLKELLSTGDQSVRAKILAAMAKDGTQDAWPTSRPDRTIAELMEAAKEIEQEKRRKGAARKARERKQSLAKMIDEPESVLKKCRGLISERSITSYEQASQLLAELREALANTGEAGLAEREAQRLKQKHPTRRHLQAALRRQGLLPK